ncbi:outer membrane protein [Ensifer sp. MJa1]|uniref:outer membrane protein n=1 Tax=Ensifer sp. MJa1 TaxID=2919888 RepID=UPI003008B4FA
MKRILSGVVAILLSGTAAFAADVYQPPVEAPVVEQPVEVLQTSGWYLRGDVGYAWNNLRGANYYQGGPGGTITEFETADIDDSWVIGGGVGYQFNNYLRADVTVDYWGNGDFNGSTLGNCGSFPGPCRSSDVSSVSAWSVMANAYVDIGTYGAFTPYVGAGIGATHVKWDGLRNTSCEIANPGNCDPTTDHDGEDDWRFTYALMAGTAIDLTCNLKADIGYRFRQVDDGDMFAFANGGGPGFDDGFYIHEARAGLRYSFGNVCEVPYEPPPEPIVYK